MLTPLLLRSLRRIRALLLSLVLLLAGFEVVLVIAAAYLHESHAFSELAAFLPMFLQQLVGAAVFGSFAGVVAFGYFHPIVVITFVGAAVYVGSEPAGEVEDRLVDLVLSRPVPRVLVVARTALAFALTTAIMAGTMVAASTVAVGALLPDGARPPRVSVLLELSANLVAVSWTFGAMALALASTVRRRAAAAGTAAVAAIALYLLDFLAGVSPRLSAAGPFSPFHYFEALPILSGTAQNWTRDMAVLLGSSAILAALAFATYARRDL
jgi:ABC-type transport system involved in multi-copper enzyme maturation permease subunit